MSDRKGILSYLLITFGITYLVEIAMILAGFRVDSIPALGGQLAIAAVMWAPTVATFITIRWVTHEKVSSINLRFGPSWKPYLAMAVLIPLVYLITYLVTWALGLGQPDWHLKTFYSLIASTGADMSQAPDPTMLLIAFTFMSLLTSPFINGIFGLGEEIGWRGYLLPRLMLWFQGQPAGKWKAYGLLGVIWGLWHAPIVAVGFNYPGRPVLGILMMVLLTTAIGITINEMTLRYRSTILAGWIHGVFNSQAYGIWRSLLFASTNPFVGGISGIVGLVILFLTGAATVLWAKQAGPAGQPVRDAGMATTVR